MIKNQKLHSTDGLVIILLVLVNVIILESAFINNAKWYWLLIGTLPLLWIGIFNIRQKKIK